jgi:SulP family sulfate permease
MSLLSRIRRWVALPQINPFVPKSVICLLEGYTKKTLFHDLFAGITVGVISLPLAMALAISAGVDPEKGLYTACVGGFLISLFGGSRFLVGGPTGAFVALIYTIVSVHGYAGLQAATLMAGLILIVLGICRLGKLIRFVSYPVFVGFTNGIAITLAISQFNNFLGLTIPHPAPDAIDKLFETASFLSQTAFIPTVYALATLVLIFLFKKVSKKIPAIMCALTIVVLIQLYFQFPVSTIQSAFGSIPRTLPSPEIPHISFELLRKTFPDAISIALLAAIESLLCAVIADSMASTKHKSDCELIGQGIGNLGSVLFGGIPATAAVARTAVNVQLQAKTPFAGMFHALTILAMMWLLAPYANVIPLSALAAVLLSVSWNMFEYDQMLSVFRGSKAEALIMIITMLITVLVHISTAVQVGVLLSIIMFMKKSIKTTSARALESYKVDELIADTIEKEESWMSEIPPSIKIVEIEGPLFFGVSDILAEALPHLEEIPKKLILRFRLVPFIDQTGVQSLVDFHKSCIKKNIELYFSELKTSTHTILKQSGVLHALGEGHVLKKPTDILSQVTP